MGNVAQSRPLGPLEHNMTYGDQVSRLNFCTLARISGPLRPEYVEAGLRELQARHPLMRSEMEDRSGRPHFVERVTAPIPLEVLEDVGEAEWTPLVEERLQRFIDPTQGPLLRCTLIRHRAGDDGSWTLALLFHHAIGDAISGAYSTRDLLEAVGRHAAMAGGDSPGRPARPALPLPTNVEAHIPEPIRAKGLWRQFWAAMGWILGWVLRHGRPLGPRLDRKRVRLAARRVVMAPEVLAAGETRALAERSKAEGTTVHGAIGAAILLAVQEDHGKRGPQLLGSPVNLRDRLTPSVGEDVGLFVSMGASLHSIDPERDAFWDLARSVRDDLVSFVDAGRAFTLIPVQAMGLAWLARRRLHPPLYASIARNVQLPGVGLTNIGRVAIESVYGPLRIERLGFAASPGVLADFAVTAATLDDTLWMNFMAMEPCITRAHAERLAARTAALLREHGVGVRSAA